MADVFISYCHEDGQQAHTLARAMENAGWSVWSDRSLVPGVEWERKISAELRTAQCVVVVWSVASVLSLPVQEEAALALVHRKYVPVSFDRSLPPSQFGAMEVLDLSRWLGRQDDPNLQLLVTAVAKKLGREPSDVRSSAKLNKNRSRLKVWGITIGGTFYGFASGVIAKTAVSVGVAAVAAVGAYEGYKAVEQKWPLVRSLVTSSPEQKPSASNTAQPQASGEFTLSAKLLGHTGPVLDAEFTSDGMRVVSLSSDGTTRHWVVATGSLLSVHRQEAAVAGVAISPDGSRVATADGQSARVWDLTTGRQLMIVVARDGGSPSIAFSPDGSLLLVGGSNNTANLLEVATGRLLAVLSGHTAEISSASFSPDGRSVLTGSADGTAKLWDTARGTLLRSFRLSGPTTTAVFSPDGTRILTSPDRGDAQVWDTATGARVGEFMGRATRVSSAKFSPDGGRVITMFGSVVDLWDARSGKFIASLAGHSSPVKKAVFSADGSELLTASGDNTARVWNARTGELVMILTGHTGGVNSASFSPDGTTVATASDDSEIHLWKRRQ